MYICFINIMKYKVLLYIALSLILLSCTTNPKDPIAKLEDLVKDIRIHHQQYTAVDWKQAFAEYENISVEMENYQYTEEEMEKVGRLEGECVGYFMKGAVRSLGGIENEIKGFVDGFKESLDK